MLRWLMFGNAHLSDRYLNLNPKPYHRWHAL
jgi:hypothetical protein